MKTRKASITISAASALGLSQLAALYYFLPAPTASETASAGPSKIAAPAEVQAAYGKLPLHFEAKQGQTDAQADS